MEGVGQALFRKAEEVDGGVNGGGWKSTSSCILEEFESLLIGNVAMYGISLFRYAYVLITLVKILLLC